MLVRFAVDPSALLDRSTPLWKLEEISRRAIDLWIEYGIFVHSHGDVSQCELVQAVANLPTDIRNMWKIGLKMGRSIPGPRDWIGLSPVESASDLTSIADELHVACLEDFRAELVGLPESDVSVLLNPNGPEVVRLPSIDRSERFITARTIGNTEIVQGKRICDLWAERFATISRHSRSVTVIDRYAIVNHMDGQGGLERFLEELDATASNTIVVMYAAIPNGVSKADVERDIRNITLGRGGVRELKAFLLTHRDFGERSHPRTIRFDNTVFEIDIGLEIFFGSEVRRETTCSYKRKTKPYNKREEELRQLAFHEFRVSYL